MNSLARPRRLLPARRPRLLHTLPTNDLSSLVLYSGDIQVAEAAKSRLSIYLSLCLLPSVARAKQNLA